MSEFKCSVSQELFRRAALCQSKEETRYYLRGVHVTACEAGGALLVATDGHKMIVLCDPAGYVEGNAIVSLNRDMLKPVKYVGDARIVIDGGKATVVQRDKGELREAEIKHAQNPGLGSYTHQFSGVIVDGTFPDWRRVIPNGDIGPCNAAFNADNLAILGKALGAGGLHAPPVIKVYGVSEDPLTPCIVFGDPSVQGFAVVMPVRIDQKHERPAWF